MVRFVWDEVKRRRNIGIHALDFEIVAESFDFEEALIEPSYPGPDGRARFKAIGPLGNDLVALVFSMLGTEAMAIISLRPASRKERKRYAEY